MKHVLPFSVIFLANLSLFGQTGTVAEFQKISSIEGNLASTLAENGGFGFVSESQTENIIFSASPFTGNGDFIIITLNTDGSVESEEKISADDYDFFQSLSGAEFGSSVVDLGDINSDGKNELIVGAPGIEGGKLFTLISQSGNYELEELGLPTEVLNDSERLGDYLAFEDGLLYASSMQGTGKIFQFGLDLSEGAILLETIDANHPLLAGKLEEGDQFGSGLSLSDVNQDGKMDLLCGAPGDDDQDTNFGAVYMLLSGETETVSEVKKLSRLEGDFGGFLNVDDEFGSSVRAIGDLDENGAIDLAVGAPGDDDGGTNIGSVWILFMHPEGWVINERKINRFEGNFTFDLGTEDRLSARIATVGDLNSDGTIDIVVSAEGDDDGSSNSGAAYVLFIEQCPAPSGDFGFEVNGPSVTFSAEGGEGYSYIWNFDDGGFSEQQNPTHTYQSTGTYMVCLAINNDCGGDNFCKNVQVSSILSTNELTSENVDLFPNPSNDLLQITGISSLLQYRIIDITGKTVDSGQLINSPLNVSDLKEGIYLLDLVSAGNRLVKKFQVVR
ncbi:MAG: PKD domain-containing protein [Bacteroidota bacterium]